MFNYRNFNNNVIVFTSHYFFTVFVDAEMPEFCRAGDLLRASKSTDTRLTYLSIFKCHRTEPGSNLPSWGQKASASTV